MKKSLFSGVFILLISFLYAGGASEEPQPVTVYIAASTTDVINEIAELFTKQTGMAVKINPASSGTLAKQIGQGAPADIYISASKKWMDYVQELGVTSDVSPLVGNRLVLISPVDSALDSFSFDTNTGLPGFFSGYLSIGDPEHVPAGKYAKEALGYYGWYEELLTRILPGADVRAALSVVEFAEAEVGIVYETDAAKSDKVKIIGAFPSESHTPIAYYCALLKGGSSGGKDFYQFILDDPEAGSLFKKYGFTLR